MREKWSKMVQNDVEAAVPLTLHTWGSVPVTHRLPIMFSHVRVTGTARTRSASEWMATPAQAVGVGDADGVAVGATVGPGVAGSGVAMQQAACSATVAASTAMVASWVACLVPATVLCAAAAVAASSALLWSAVMVPACSPTVATSPAMVVCIAAIMLCIATTESLRPRSGTPMARTSQSGCESRSRWQPVRRTLTWCPVWSWPSAAAESSAQATSILKCSINV